MRFTRMPPMRIALRALMTTLLLPMLLVAATTPTWQTALPDGVDPDSVQLLELRLLACIQTCMKRACVAVVHKDLYPDQKCQLVPGDGTRAPSAALLRLVKPLTDVAIRKPVRASSIADPEKSPSLVTDGDFNTEFRTEAEDFPFVVVDLGTPYDIEEVSLFGYSIFFYSFEMRLGMEDMPGPDFSSYTLVPNLTTGCGLLARSCDKKLNVPVRAKFVSLQRMEKKVALSISHLTVYGR